MIDHADSTPLHERQFPAQTNLTTLEQQCRFELSRLAFFALKLQKLERWQIGQKMQAEDRWTWHFSLLRHAIFQQVIRLTSLGARTQALRIIMICRSMPQQTSTN